MVPIRLLIVEDNALQRELYTAALESQANIQVVYAAANGADALQSLVQLQPDVVLFDMVMPQLDGFALLDNVHRLPEHMQPVMIALTSLGRDDFITRAVDLGVDDYLIKPIDPVQLTQRIEEIFAQRRAVGQPVPHAPTARRQEVRPEEPQPAATDAEALSPESIRKYVTLLLMQLDMPAHLLGYQYLTEAIVLAVQTPSIVNRMTAQLYPCVAAQCGATASRVERSIRNAVAITWDRGGGTALNRILARTTTIPADKPTNGELIAQLAARIRMKEKR